MEDRYDQTNRAKLYQVQKEINNLVQGSLDITTYYTRMKRLWEELNTLSGKSQHSCVCTCGSKKMLHKEEQDRRLIQFSMGLNEVYTIVRGSILMMKPLPSLAQAFSLPIQKEKQREFRPNNQLNLESTSLHVNATFAQHQNPFGARNFKTHYTPNNRGQPFCDYCKRPDHAKEKCYKLHPQVNSYNNQSFNNTGAQQFNQRNNSNQTQRHKFNRGKGSWQMYMEFQLICFMRRKMIQFHMMRIKMSI
ncbi:PREDICTED: uncharacterized protein LOC109214736 [Nicotiana attenuata]|uniref:uncharacterized protein LOC109214736 n=1 Tax=Nicotiana attenuata TaxID=49451 RepID=UPI0009048F9E|nr:PREDICTED: uncharacterized protein LOC109214736 [Nicotiana attenuata]